MNRNTFSFPLLAKDLHQLLWGAVVTLALQTVAFLALVVFRYGRFYTFGWTLFVETWDCGFAPFLQAAFTAFYTLVAAAIWMAEEREAGTERFLRRLPASRARVWGEKLAAGLIAVGVLLVLQAFWMLAGCALWGVPFWFTQTRVFFHITLCALVSVLIGFPLSWWLRNSSSVIILGAIAQCVFWWIFELLPLVPVQSNWDFNAGTAELSVMLAPALLPALLFGLLHLAAQTYAGARFGMRWFGGGLFPLEISRQWLHYGLASSLLLAAVILWINKTALQSPDVEFAKDSLCIVCIIAVVAMLTALGFTLYSNLEKNGIRCVLYHHSISRHRVFWAKFGAALPSVLLYAFAFFALCLALFGPDINYLDTKHWRTWIFPLQVGLSLPLFMYLCCLLISFVGDRSWIMQGIKGASAGAIGVAMVLFYLSIALEPMFSDAASWECVLESFVRDPFSGSAPEVVFPLLGLTLGAWFCSARRDLLAGSCGKRSSAVMQLLLVIPALHFLIFFTDFRDLLFLVTGIDFGKFP